MSVPIWAIKGMNKTFSAVNKTKNIFKKGTSSKIFKKTKGAVKEYGPTVAIASVLGAGIGSIATAGYNKATGYKNIRVKKNKKKVQGDRKVNMPKGKGTYGSKKGRPRKKNKKKKRK